MHELTEWVLRGATSAVTAWRALRWSACVGGDQYAAAAAGTRVRSSIM